MKTYLIQFKMQDEDIEGNPLNHTEEELGSASQAVIDNLCNCEWVNPPFPDAGLKQLVADARGIAEDIKRHDHQERGEELFRILEEMEDILYD